MWREPGAGRGAAGGGGQFKDMQAGARCVLYDPVGRAALLPFPTEEVSTGRQAVLSAGGRPRVPLCSSRFPAENSVLARKGSALAFLTELLS